MQMALKYGRNISRTPAVRQGIIVVVAQTEVLALFAQKNIYTRNSQTSKEGIVCSEVLVYAKWLACLGTTATAAGSSTRTSKLVGIDLLMIRPE